MHSVHVHEPASTFSGTPYVDWIKPQMQAEDMLERRLGEIELSPDDIDIVVNTHLHFDHAGGNSLFPQATFLVQRDHYKHALGMPEAFPPRYYLLPGLNYELLQGEITLIPGVDLILSPGHVPGMQSVVVSLPETGTVILASDAISLEEHLNEDNWGGYWNPKSARASARRIRAIAQAKRGQIFFGHDPAWWQNVIKSPEHYT
jgi:N-acyl homoserine lactone hydrolase